VINLILFLVHRYYAWDYRVLKTFARHYSTGDVIPEKLVESMLGAKNMFAATDLQRQVFFLLFFLMHFWGRTGWCLKSASSHSFLFMKNRINTV